MSKLGISLVLMAIICVVMAALPMAWAEAGEPNSVKPGILLPIPFLPPIVNPGDIRDSILGAKKETDANTRTVTEPNDSKIGEELDNAWRELGRNDRAEIREWCEPGVEERLGLLKKVYDRSEDELELIRQVAIAEGAERTVTAIDQVMAMRTTTMTKIEEKAKEARKEAQKTEREHRRQRRAPRRGREDRDRSSRHGSSRRETTPEEPQM